MGVLPGFGLSIGTRGLESDTKPTLGICGHTVLSNSSEFRSSLRVGIAGELSSGGYFELFAGLNVVSKYIDSMKSSSLLWFVAPDDYGIRVSLSNGAANYYHLGLDIHACVGYAFFINP